MVHHSQYRTVLGVHASCGGIAFWMLVLVVSEIRLGTGLTVRAAVIDIPPFAKQREGWGTHILLSIE